MKANGAPPGVIRHRDATTAAGDPEMAGISSTGRDAVELRQLPVGGDRVRGDAPDRHAARIAYADFRHGVEESPITGDRHPRWVLQLRGELHPTDPSRGGIEARRVDALAPGGGALGVRANEEKKLAHEPVRACSRVDKECARSYRWARRHDRRRSSANARTTNQKSASPDGRGALPSSPGRT